MAVEGKFLNAEGVAYSGENDQVVWLKTIMLSAENDRLKMQKLEVS